jgi:polar amino acid transport system substrate-binding protein
MNLFLKSLFFAYIFAVSVFANSVSLEKVSLQLPWKHQFQFAGYYMAKEKGFYKDAGLDVNILEYENGIDLTQRVIQNKHSFGVGRSGLILDEINTNEIVLLSSIFQSSPYVLVSLKSSGIKSIEEFKNKKMMIDTESKHNTAFISMLHSHGISFKDMQIQEPTFKVKSLINEDTDIAAWYLSNELYTLDKRGIEYDIWNPKDYGFDFYSDLLFTSKRELNENPDIVEGFRNASLKGWKYAFDHIDETVEMIVKKYNTQNKSEGALLYEAKVLKKLTYSTNKEFGIIEKEKIQRLFDIYNLLGLYKNNVNIEDLIYKVSNKFSLTHKEREYLQKKNVIKICVDPNWMPLDAINKNGQHVGVAADILKTIAKNSNIEFQLVSADTWVKSMELAKQRKCDIYPMAMETPSRKTYMDFAPPYVSIPMVIATKSSEIFIDSLKAMQGKKVSLVKGYAFVELLNIKYPKIKIVEVDSLMQGIQFVREGKVNGHLEPLISLAYTLREEGITDVKIAGKFDDLWSLSIATRSDEPILKSIMKKALDTIDDKEIQDIYNKWLAVKFEERVDYTLIYKIGAVVVLFVLFGMWRYYEIHKINKLINQKNEELEKLSTTDQLTNIFNRRKIDEMLQVNKELADRYGAAFGVIMLDIDHFKKVNDTYGHHVGDITLQTFATLLVEHTRKSDIVGRWGGEEFLIIIPHATQESIMTFAQNLRIEIESYNFKDVGHATASLGASLYYKNESYDNVVARADKALYTSKESGRNCVNFLGTTKAQK